MLPPIINGAGVSTGQPDRADFVGAEHSDRLIPGRRLDIGSNTVGGPRNRRETSTERWRRQESLVREQGTLLDERGLDWSSFSGASRRGGGRNLGQVKIDAPQGPEPEPLQTFTPEQLKNGMWAEVAAGFEESQRSTAGQYGVGQGPALPPIVVGSDRGEGGARPKSNRRAFRVG